MKTEIITTRLLIEKCSKCSHRGATHKNIPSHALAVDLHEQYDQTTYLNALRETRRRQAGLILKKLIAVKENINSLLDYGCGRGWFLLECKSLGIKQLTGADTSSLALQWLRDQNFEIIDLSKKRLSAKPVDVLTFLDVLEHFPLNDFLKGFAKLLDEFTGDQTLIVVKVPLSNGFFYKLANIFAQWGIVGPLEKLYLTETYPPHFHYFSKKSIQKLFEHVNLNILQTFDDIEFEPYSLLDRGGMTKIPPLIKNFIGYVMAFVIRLTRAFDTRVYFGCKTMGHFGQQLKL